MPDGHAPTPPTTGTDADLHAAMVVLSAAEKYAVIAGLKGRSRDPREQPDHHDCAAEFEGASAHGPNLVHPLPGR